MLALSEILSHFPEQVHHHERDILKEYVQYFVLDGLFSHPLGKKLIFIGGTNLRLVHGNLRFSEDLDFDNVGLTRDDFLVLGDHLKDYFGVRGIELEVDIKEKIAFHMYLKFPVLLGEYGLSPYTRKDTREKLLIKVDTHDQGYDFVHETFLLQKFGVNRFINVAPISLLMAHKIVTIGQRKRAKGRDYFDLIFLQSKQISPDYAYLQQMIGIETPEQIQQYLLDIYASKNADRLHKDVSPFLFNPYDDSIRNFELYVKGYEYW